MNKKPIASACLVGSMLTSVASAQSYSVIALDTPTVQSAALAVNNQGVSVGYDLGLTGHFAGVRWVGTGAIVFAAPAPFAQAHSSAVNGAGDAATMLFSLGAFSQAALLVDASGNATNLGAYLPRSMNDFGVIVGKRDVTLATGWHTEEAVRWHAGTLVSLGTAGDVTSEASDTNNNGLIVGSYIPSGQLRPVACAWINGQRSNLGTLPGGTSAQAMAINEAGQVVGVSDATASGGGAVKHAYRLMLSPSGVVSDRVDLGELGHGFSYAYAINASGTVVGTSDARAFVWENGTMTDLNTRINPSSGWTLYAASGISDDGRIVGWGRHNAMEPRAFMLVPEAACYADCDGSGALDIDDFICFQTFFAVSAPYADCDGSGELDIDDFICFQTFFAIGC